jgi:hypothetical protein
MASIKYVIEGSPRSSHVIGAGISGCQGCVELSRVIGSKEDLVGRRVGREIDLRRATLVGSVAARGRKGKLVSRLHERSKLAL